MPDEVRRPNKSLLNTVLPMRIAHDVMKSGRPPRGRSRSILPPPSCPIQPEAMRLPRQIRLPHLRDIGALLTDSALRMVAPSRFQQAALSLYMVFSLAPMLILVIAVAGAFFGEEAVRRNCSAGCATYRRARRRGDPDGAGQRATNRAAAGWPRCCDMRAGVQRHHGLRRTQASLDELWDVKEDKSGLQGLCAAAAAVIRPGAGWRCSCCLLTSTRLGALRDTTAISWSTSAFARWRDWLSNLFFVRRW